MIISQGCVETSPLFIHFKSTYWKSTICWECWCEVLPVFSENLPTWTSLLRQKISSENNFSQAIQVTILCFQKGLSHKAFCKNFIRLLLSEQTTYPLTKTERQAYLWSWTPKLGKMVVRWFDRLDRWIAWFDSNCWVTFTVTSHSTMLYILVYFKSIIITLLFQFKLFEDTALSQILLKKLVT